MRFARDRAAFAVESLAAEEQYDLVVVGGGHQRARRRVVLPPARGAQARILILDNHDDFGGHAKRNEFMLDGRLVIGYGGSQSINSPNAWWSETGKGLLRELGVDIRRFETAFERDLYPALGLSRGMFFTREAFGRDRLATGDSLIQPRRARASQRQAAHRVRRGPADLRARQDATPRPLFVGT